ncbi:PSD1 and planctomycete cytochrome C domain-containing protein [Blastopirellula sp. JC732]|uniref:PSD1 and planctomycete cytochrome C domain-containing protein n=1 Tax=Blastopirellula sediminis TaxID=2894196 RepID=A0A9X1MJ71_9BACT|nr:PSD1 and planctomycete cytochrome C domain-containing protein [Blastopirellula sediminis]MCC9609419.1 PSD1 and planctomycete cytochrome C domain-containing protein [Blastopirellula sediminis]MCC9627804.1 PSD1 and planctomycete cytochrome C domain-containing protein [Blastopirellula sediminis]
MRRLDHMPLTHEHSRSLFSLLSGGLLLFLIAPVAFAEDAASEYSAEQLTFFEAKIRPVLVKECYCCHSEKAGNIRGGLRLDTRELTHIGGDNGPAVVPGDLEQSLLYNAVNHEDFRMPPNRKLAPEVIADIRAWIEMGAPDPRERQVEQIQPSVTAEDIAQAREQFWAYQPLRQPEVPQTQDSNWAITDIDRFILAQLEGNELPPAADAEPQKVLRRLYFDLIGIPPTPEEIQDFENVWKKNPSDAVEQVVDRLLEMPQFGERWGRHWLDVVRYAESTGREVNMTYPHAWRYRDYVIDAFNSDKPFNEFAVEQLAGDLLPAKSDEESAENIVATTFLAIGPKNVNERNRIQFQADLVDEQIDATTRVFLGSSVSCARCHDHKFDAFRQADYYALAGMFNNLTTFFGAPPSDYGPYRQVQVQRTSSLIPLPVDDPNDAKPKYTSVQMEKMKDEMKELREEAAEVRRDMRSGDNQANVLMRLIRTSNRLAELSAKLGSVDENGIPISFCMGVKEERRARDLPVLIRGEIDQRGAVVPRGLPQVFATESFAIPSESSGRREFAEWVGSADNPLTSRVMVNRIWQNLLGYGIVRSPENFGVTGESPTHPELLDHLALEFVKSNWSVKTLVKEIATSRVYRISSAFSPSAHEIDPSNRLLWRANPRRLDAESLRDAMLAISGSLDEERPHAGPVYDAGYTRVRGGTLGGSPEDIRAMFQSAMNAQRGQGGGFGMNQGGFGGRFRTPFMPRPNQPNAFANAMRSVTHQLDMEDAKFRSVYLPIVRDELPRSLEAFDFADPNSITGVRESSNTPNQALYMMNNPFVLKQADALAGRVTKEHNSLGDQIDLAFQLCYGRSPTVDERTASSNFLRQFNETSASQRSRTPGSPLAMAAFCQALLASAEFRLID